MLRKVSDEEHTWRRHIVSQLDSFKEVADSVGTSLLEGDYTSAMEAAEKLNHGTVRLCRELIEAIEQAEKEESETFAQMMGSEEGDG